jgi:phosphate transport system substrate-binding protein
MRTRNWLIATLTVLAVVAAACGSSNTDTTATAGDGDGGSGTILISGSSTVEPISARVAEEYSNANSGVGITVEGPGTGDGFKKFCAGETDISDASRAIKDTEADACAEAGIDWIELHIAIDGLSVLTSPENDLVSCVTFNDLYALTGPESTGFGTWSDAAGLAQEIGGVSATNYIDEDLAITGPGEESGTYDTFVEFVIEDLAEERGQDSATRPDYVASPNDNVIIEGIAGSRYSLGWVGYAYFAENTDQVAALEVNAGDSGCVAPTEDTIASGEYPLSRPLYIYVNAQKVAGNPVLESFVDYYMSDEGLAEVSNAGYVPLADYGLTQDAWNNKVIGPNFSS